MSYTENMTPPEQNQKESFDQEAIDAFATELQAACAECQEPVRINEEELVHELSGSSGKLESEKETNPVITQFLQKLDQQTEAAIKLQLTIDFMQESISQSGNPQFRNFWEARRRCLDFFKENIAPSVRIQLWAKYRELSSEARRLKEILDEQSAFASEQIDVAITALENDIKQTQECLEKQPEVIFPLPSKIIESKARNYAHRQRELNLLNAYATRINGLRKELIKTEMRIRQKNKFFKRLSAAGDCVFPRRKDLIRETSQQFIDDVEQFVTNCKSADEADGQSLYFYREEIKALQGIAKTLTLNTQAFTSTRAKLSECWDKIKVLEKDRKREQAQKRQVFKQNSDGIMAEIQQFSIAFSAGEISIHDATPKLDEIASKMRRTELGRQELSEIREALNQARKPIVEKIQEKENERLQEEAVREKKSREKMQELRKKIGSLLENAKSFDGEQLSKERDTLQQEILDQRCTKSEKMELERLLKPIRDIVSDKKEQALLKLPENDQEALRQMREVLRQRKERRKEIKDQLELLRKAGKTSGLDFEQAIIQSESINSEKERLEKANQAIQEIEDQIAELESRI